ncbi:protein mono-ADP-ribosyltransferase PARP6-like, partial [Ruditapes philippinarum]|uniref:protein mono-ADP-ribosyltransferase PARP6-like n=1 Tax=Ruditapes philippinarum TaxID=129788 RepID=UPI00295AD0E2
FSTEKKSISYRLFETLDEIDVELHVPIGFLLDEVTADAWGVLRTEPLVTRLNLSLSQYLESSNPPKVEVFQLSKKEGFRFGSQVRKNVLRIFCRLNGIICVEGTIRSISEGFECSIEPDLARNALIITRGNIDEASKLILENPNKCAEGNGETFEDVIAEAVPSKSESSSPAEIKNQKPFRSISQLSEDENVFQFGEVDIFNEDLYKGTKTEKPKEKPEEIASTDLKRQLSHPTVLNKLKRMLPSLARTTSVMPEHSTSCVIEDLNLMHLSKLDGKNAKVVPSIADGFLIQVFRYVRQRIPTMNEYCVICDARHVFQNGAMLKPTVCGKELCVFAFLNLGVMADAVEDIEVVDLLISLTRAAALSNCNHIIFDPFPTVIDPDNTRNLLFTPNNRDYDLVKKVLQEMPSMSDMACMTSSLKQKLDQSNRSVYPVIQWIITSNRSHIVKLSPERRLEFMHTPHQFLLLSSPPAKEAAFQEAKKKHGSTFAFHGSSIENWHSIIRQGLMNASGTKLQVNGAAYGEGIYLSPHISTSMDYSRMGYGSHSVNKNKSKPDTKTRFLTSSNITCIAICEVITSPLKKNNAIWVCPEPDNVCTRFFFVYEDGQVGDSSIDTQDSIFLKQIQEACGYKV